MNDKFNSQEDGSGQVRAGGRAVRKRKAGDDKDRRDGNEATEDSRLHKRGGSPKETHHENLFAPTRESVALPAVKSALGLLQEAKKGTPPPEVALLRQSSGGGPNPLVNEEGVTFPEKLMELLMNETDKEALWWLPDGSTFALNSKTFTETILAQKFQGSKFESFTRKLARWGFKRLSGPNIPPHTFMFEHPLFKRDHPELAKEISGSRNKKIAPLSEENPPVSKSNPVPVSSPSPAPWPTFGDHSVLAVPGALLPDNASQMFLQGRAGAVHTGPENHILGRTSQNLFPPASRASTASSVDDGSRQLQVKDFEKQLFFQSMINSLNSTASFEATEDQGRGRHDPLMRATILAKQERIRSAAAAVASNSPTSRTAELQTNLQGFSPCHSNGGQGGGSPMSAFHPETSTLQSTIQQQTASFPPASSAGLDPLVRLYLQQHEAVRQENLILQQELLRLLGGREPQRKDSPSMAQSMLGSAVSERAVIVGYRIRSV